jgi:hypothetical protein
MNDISVCFRLARQAIRYFGATDIASPVRAGSAKAGNRLKVDAEEEGRGF